MMKKETGLVTETTSPLTFSIAAEAAAKYGIQACCTDSLEARRSLLPWMDAAKEEEEEEDGRGRSDL